MSDARHVNATLDVVGGALLAGRYRLAERIGRGGMADVFRARDEVLHRDVAVKVFRFDTAGPEERQRVDAEVRTLASLRHPGLVTVFDAGTRPVDEDGDGEATPFLVMELITGPTLARRLSDGPLAPDRAAQLGADLAETLGYVHSRGVVHRDVKPANILLDVPTGSRAEFSARLTDFGVARILDSARLTMHGTTIGTANYLSPEQAQGGPITPASDVYSLGLVLLECLTGHIAYPGTGMAAAAARLHRPPDLPVEAGTEWTQLLGAMTSFAPQDRPSTSELTAALTRLASEPTERAPAAVAPVAPVGTATAATTALPHAELGPSPQRGSDATKPLTTLLKPRDTSGRRRGSTRSRWAWVAVAAAAVVALVIALLVSVGNGNRSTPAPAPSYSSVPGQLGTHLRQLEGTLP